MEPNRETLQGEVRVGDKKHCFIQLEGTIALLTLAPTVRYTAGHGHFPVDSPSSTPLTHCPTNPNKPHPYIYYETNISCFCISGQGPWWGLVSRLTD